MNNWGGGGGAGKEYVGPPLKLLGGGGWAGPSWPPFSYAYAPAQWNLADNAVEIRS